MLGRSLSTPVACLGASVRRSAVPSLASVTAPSYGCGNLDGNDRSTSQRPYITIPDRTVSVIGAPMRFGQPLGGVELAPKELRKHGLLENIEKLGWNVVDRGDVFMPEPSRDDPVSPFGGQYSYVVGVGNQRIASQTQAAAEDDHFVLTLGGDHSVAMGSIGGLLRVRPSMGIIWVDAHADINDPRTSPSGNIHGMPLSFLTRIIDPAGSPGCEWVADLPRLDPSKIVYIGLRDVDEGEVAAIKELNIKTFTMQHIDRFGIGAVMDMTLDHLYSSNSDCIHLSYDIDALDPSVAPSTGTTVKGGLNYREAHYVAEACSACGLLASMDLVEVNPKLVSDISAMMTVVAGAEIVTSAMGKSILGQLHHDKTVSVPETFPLPPPMA